MAMKIARSTRAMSTPMSSTRCCRCEGTENFAMIRTKTKRLSTLSDFSVMNPAKNSPEAWLSPHDHEAESEEDGQGDPDDCPDPGFLGRHVMGLAPDEEVDGDEGRQTNDGQGPYGP